MQNRGQRDLREATVAAGRAEKLLTGVNLPRRARAAEPWAAVTALQRAFVRDRYILRALASRTNLDPARRRLTGNASEAHDLAAAARGRAGESPGHAAGDLLSGARGPERVSAGTAAPDIPIARASARHGAGATHRRRVSGFIAPGRAELERAADAGDGETRAQALAAAAVAASVEARRSNATARWRCRQRRPFRSAIRRRTFDWGGER